jgi:long-chain acyl-CoA synthetase
MRVEHLLYRSASASGELTAVAAAGRTLSFAELDDSSNRLATALAAGGVTGGARVALHLDDMHAAVIGFFAILKAGAVACPIDPTLSAGDLGAALAECRAVGIVTEARLAATAAVALSQIAGVTLVMLVGGDRSAAEHGCVRFEDAISRSASAPRPATGEGEAALLFETGHGSLPTPVSLSHAELIAAAAGVPLPAPQPLWTRGGLQWLVAATAAVAPLRFERRAAPRGAYGHDWAGRRARSRPAAHGVWPCPA